MRLTNNKYKFDSRNKEQFIADMEKGLKAEVSSINTFREILSNSSVENPEVVYVGSDEEGKITYSKDGDIANVDLFPDYLLKYKEDRRIRANFIEVKVCNPHSRECFFKVKQLEQYKGLDKVVILFVMGFDTSTPKFILVKPEEVLNLGIEPVYVYGKKTIKVPTDAFNWEDFSGNIEDRGNILTKKYIKERKQSRKGTKKGFSLSESVRFKM
jgi:hypothetical protein